MSEFRKSIYYHVGLCEDMVGDNLKSLLSPGVNIFNDMLNLPWYMDLPL